jgi:hypothetical protein
MGEIMFDFSLDAFEFVLSLICQFLLATISDGR